MNTRASILVVDDEEVVRRAHLRTLASERCAVHAVRSGDEALDALQSQPYDLVLLDLRMPGLDGMSVLRIVKERWPEAEVIVITGYPCVETAKEAIRLGAHDYLAKPVPPDEVIAATQCALNRKQWLLRRERTADAANPTHGACNPAGAAH